MKDEESRSMKKIFTHKVKIFSRSITWSWSVYLTWSWSVHSTTIIFFLIISLGVRKKQIFFFVPIFRKIFFFMVTIIITERFNIHFSRITWLAAMWHFLPGCAPNFIDVSLLYYWNWYKSLPTAALLHNFQNISQAFDTKGAMKICFNSLQFGKCSFQFRVRNWNRK